MNIVEKRTGTRVKSTMPVGLLSPATDGNTTLISSFNLSVVGICLETGLPLPQNGQVELEIPTSAGKLRLKAEVIWNRENQYGCKFVDIDPITLRRLSQWLYPPFEP